MVELKEWFNESKNIFIVTSKVKHSQRWNDPPEKCWSAVRQDGEILFGHCTCMAGLGEVCSHVSASHFHLVAHVNLIAEQSCTSRPCEWKIPVTHKDCPYDELANINFKKKPKEVKPWVPRPPGLSDNEEKLLYERLKATGMKPAVLSLIPGYAQEYTPKSITLPKSFQSLYDKKFETLPGPELADKCESIYSQLSFTKEQIKQIAEFTTEQSKSKLWYSQRAGKISASKAKACVSTSVQKPSISLIRSVCYPDLYKFSCKETAWGCTHEKQALANYEQIIGKKHDGFKRSKTGFHISHKHPFIGASPDGIVRCTCCGTGLVEVKCPFNCSKKDEKLENVSFLKSSGTNLAQLDTNHKFFYQVQIQMYVLELRYCDFVAWCKRGDKIELYVERIFFNQSFIDSFIPKATLFFREVILPELLCKKFTNANVKSMLTGSAPSNTLMCSVCYCGQHGMDSPIATCSSKTCSIKQYHFKCLKIKRMPSKTWLCPTCKKQTASVQAVKVTQPTGSASSTQSTGSVKAIQLTSPVSTTQPTGSVSTTRPTGSVKPKQPTASVSTTQPTGSVNPKQPTESVKLKQPTGSVNPTQSTGSVCYCGQQGIDSPIVTCYSEECSIKHYHLECLQVKRKPSKTWLCSTCKKLKLS